MEELLKKLESLEENEFYHKMKDHWTANDFIIAGNYAREIRKVKEELKALGWQG